MGRLAWRNALAVAALLTWLPASAEELKLTTVPQLLTPSTSVARSQGKKIIGYACKEILFMSPMSAPTDFVGDVVAEGRGEAVKFVVHVIGGKAAEGVCDALVEKPPTPEPDNRKSLDVSATRPAVVTSPNQPIAAPQPSAQQPCSPGQFYNMNARLCVDLEVTPNCPPGQVDVSGQCTGIAALAGPQCAAYQELDIFSNKCVLRKCAWPLFFNALEQKCVAKISFGGASCRADQLESHGTCVPMPLR